MITFLLILIGLVLVIINYKAIKNEKSNFKDTFEDASNNVKDYDIDIGKLRKEFAETLLELQQEIQDLKDNIDNGKVRKYQDNDQYDEYINNPLKEEGEEDKPLEKSEDHDNKIKESDEQENSIKINEIKQMIDDGMSMDSISEKLGIGKGEILLIEKLYLK